MEAPRVPWRVVVAGTVTLDDITTPYGHRTEQQGGSAVFTALAAARWTGLVSVVGVVGSDGEQSARATLDVSGCDLSELTVTSTPTFRWTATHDFQRWVTVGETSSHGPYLDWHPRLGEQAAAGELLFLGSMPPASQLSILRQTTPRLVASDTMTYHIESHRSETLAVVEGSDVLFLNRAELAVLTGRPDTEWRASANGLLGGGRLRAVVVKGGPEGAALVTARGIVERPAAPVETVIDPTGAGDALAGGFLGYCAQQQRVDEGVFPAALEAGLTCAAAAISDFGVVALRGALSSDASVGPPV